MQLRRFEILLVAAAAAAGSAVMSGCAESERGKEVQRTFILAGVGDPKNFDPAINDEGPSLQPARQIFETLIQHRPGTADIEPGLAERWEPDRSGRVWTFHLRKGVKFHDGTPFDAAAVCFNFDRWYTMRGKAAQTQMYYYGDVFEGFAKNEGEAQGRPVYRKCEAKDSATAVIKLSKYKGAFPAAFTLTSFSISSPQALRRYQADKVTGPEGSIAGNDYANRHPTGTGPFTFGGWDKANNTIILNRNPDYWGAAPKVDKVVIKIIKDERTRAQELRAGTVDAIDLPSPADVAALASEGYSVLTRPAFNVLYLGINQKNNPSLRDLRVRQAIAHAIDRERLVRSKAAKGATVATQFMPDTVLGYAEDVRTYPYDPAKAKSLLAAAGATGLTVNFYHPTGVTRPYLPNPREIFAVLANDLQAVGIKVNGVPRPWNGGYQEDVKTAGKHDLHLLGWTGDFNDPGNFVGTFFGRAKAEFGNQAMTAMFAQIAAAEADPDRAKKQANWQQVNRDVMARYLPAVPVWHAPPSLVTSTKVDGLVASPLAEERYASVSKS
jgi:peptide/nickel transport system substrate-binding protein